MNDFDHVMLTEAQEYLEESLLSASLSDIDFLQLWRYVVHFHKMRAGGRSPIGSRGYLVGLHPTYFNLRIISATL
jgi:hypothetical protein